MEIKRRPELEDPGQQGSPRAQTTEPCQASAYPPVPPSGPASHSLFTGFKKSDSPRGFLNQPGKLTILFFITLCLLTFSRGGRDAQQSLSS